jgi:hypothetical protein
MHDAWIRRSGGAKRDRRIVRPGRPGSCILLILLTTCCERDQRRRNPVPRAHDRSTKRHRSRLNVRRWASIRKTP